MSEPTGLRGLLNLSDSENAWNHIDEFLVVEGPNVVALLCDMAAYADGAECEGYPICMLTSRCDRCALLARFAELDRRAAQ